MFTNVHLSSAIRENPSRSAGSVAKTLPRLRHLANDPAREYAQRPGEVEKLPDSVAALILCKQGFNKVGRNGIAIELDGKRYVYWSENSITIATRADEKVLWTVNRLHPEVLHILTNDGAYVESIPLEQRPAWFNEEASKRILGSKRRVQERTMRRVRELHAPDTAEVIEATEANTAQIRGLVQTFPTRNGKAGQVQRSIRESESLPEADRESLLTSRGTSGTRGTGVPPVNFNKHSRDGCATASRIHDIQRSLNNQRAAHEDRQKTIARHVAAVTDADIDALTDSEAIEVPLSGMPPAQIENRQPDEDASDWIL